MDNPAEETIYTIHFVLMYYRALRTANCKQLFSTSFSTVKDFEWACCICVQLLSACYHFQKNSFIKLRSIIYTCQNGNRVT